MEKADLTAAVNRCKTVRASFDRLRMRKIGSGICQGPRRKSLILSLSKDAHSECNLRAGVEIVVETRHVSGKPRGSAPP